jgi:hypothetical protein
MKTKLLFAASGMVFVFMAATLLRADQVEMQNGDRYHGKVLSVTADTVVLESEVLGKVNLPRQNVASLAFGANLAMPKASTNLARISGLTNLPVPVAPQKLANPKTDLSAAFRNLGANTNFVRNIREQLLGDSPAAASKYDEMVNGLMSGKLNLNDLRREAKASADQLRALKRELGPEADDSLDTYLEVLDGFLKESATEPARTAPVSQAKTPVR